jgi:hypothetical protein
MTPNEKAGGLTQKDVRDLLEYDSESGIFTHKRHMRGITRGTVASHLLPQGHVTVGILGWRYMAHRLAWLWMTGCWPDAEIDHRNGVRNDNRWCNLRAATTKQNRENRAREQPNTSGFRGVSWTTNRNKWVAQIKHHGRQRNLGRYPDLIDAVAARLRAERELFTHHREH